MLSTKLRGGDTSYFGRMSQATRDLQEAEDTYKQAQKDFELVDCLLRSAYHFMIPKCNVLAPSISTRSIQHFVLECLPVRHLRSWRDFTIRKCPISEVF